MPTPSEIIDSFLEDKAKDALNFLTTPNQEGATLNENIKLHRKKIEEEALKKQENNFMQ